MRTKNTSKKKMPTMRPASEPSSSGSGVTSSGSTTSGSGSGSTGSGFGGTTGVTGSGTGYGLGGSGGSTTSVGKVRSVQTKLLPSSSLNLSIQLLSYAIKLKAVSYPPAPDRLLKPKNMTSFVSKLASGVCLVFSLTPP